MCDDQECTGCKFCSEEFRREIKSQFIRKDIREEVKPTLKITMADLLRKHQLTDSK